GFTTWALEQAGYTDLPRSTRGLQYTGTYVSKSNMQPGDLVFFNTGQVNGHVGIYLGGNQFIGAQSSTGVAIADMSSGSYWGQRFNQARRINYSVIIKNVVRSIDRPTFFMPFKLWRHYVLHSIVFSIPSLLHVSNYKLNTAKRNKQRA